MPISRPSASSAFGLALTLVGGAALAQDTAKSRIEREGGTAMQRLEKAVGKAKLQESTTRGPNLSARPDPHSRQRAFEGLRKHRISPEIDQRARAARAAAETQFAAQREHMAERLREALGLQPAEMDAVAKAVTRPPSSWVPVLFVSSSMPLPVLRAYAQQLERAKGVLAFRGMPGGMRKMGPMAKLSTQILRIDPGCEGPACAMRNVQIIIDPLVFRQHGIARVPALAMIPSDPAQPYCEREADSPRAAHIVYGDAALSGLIEEYRRIGGEVEVKNVQALLGGA
ncbi:MULTISPECIES: type-F conjugative transfer system pilin assembly protein TrbC [Sphingomonas]|jgi:type-F conjugative transfer system pilin assembly protein TrbC|uniref:Conjugal transfer protein TrbC n=1 Tax=Sphingomonas turrisvirgatae TaxID=1888892 RepID=A0A1E3M153_9SPHN|nr:type-F conjugative transfer system pilin assembly protein TrbC [Sphingomonas turrisvirgatae]ODP38790.1 conjugal transfer protein TrbC [Sphingomonas turrisvirgatae]